MIFAVDHPLCDVWNQTKTQILIEFLDGKKEVQLVGTKTDTLDSTKNCQKVYIEIPANKISENILFNALQWFIFYLSTMHNGRMVF